MKIREKRAKGNGIYSTVRACGGDIVRLQFWGGDNKTLFIVTVSAGLEESHVPLAANELLQTQRKCGTGDKRTGVE